MKGTPRSHGLSGVLPCQDPGIFKQPPPDRVSTPCLHLCILGLWEWSPRGNYEFLPSWEEFIPGFRVSLMILQMLAGLTGLISLFALAARKLEK